MNNPCAIISWLSLIVSFLTFMAICITAYYAKGNLNKINEANKLSKEHLDKLTNENTMKEKSEFLEQICLGILNPEGVEPSKIDNEYGKTRYERIKRNGFYDGVRAFLGDMMHFPFMDTSELERESNDNIVKYFFLAPLRFNLTWSYLFEEFDNICKLKKVPSGLDKYFDGTYKNEMHLSIPKINETLSILFNNERFIKFDEEAQKELRRKWIESKNKRAGAINN